MNGNKKPILLALTPQYVVCCKNINTIYCGAIFINGIIIVKPLRISISYLVSCQKNQKIERKKIMPKYFLPTEIVEERNNGMATLKVPHHSDGTCCTVTVNKGVLIPEDKISEKALREYKNAIKTVFNMDVDTRTHVFNPDRGRDLITLINEFSPEDFIKKVETYKERPKTGDIYIGRTKRNDDLDNAQRVVLWVDKLNKVHYIVESPTMVFISEDDVKSFLVDNVKGGTVEDFKKYFKYIYNREINY